jgi:hypothetical protein
MISMKISITDFARLPDLHLQFVFAHPTQFDMTTLALYRQKCPRRLARFTWDFLPIATFEFAPISYEISPPSLLPAIMKGMVPSKQMLLLTHFFRFTKFVIPQTQFDVLFQLIAFGKHANALVAAIDYSERHGLTFNSSSLLSDALFDFVQSSEPVLRVLRRHVSGADVPHPDVIDLLALPLDHYTVEAFFISIDPERYLSPFLASFHYTSSSLFRLARVLTFLQLSSRLVVDFVLHKLSVQVRPKRLVSLLRVLRLSLSAAGHPSEVFEHVFPLITCEDSQVRAELGCLLPLLFGTVPVNTLMIESIDNASQASVRFIPFMTVLALALVYTDASVEALNRTSLLAALTQGIPSVTRKAIEVIGHLLKGNPSGWDLFTSLALPFFDISLQFYNFPLIGAFIDKVLGLLMRRREMTLLLDSLLPSITRLAFSSLPSFPLFDQRLAFINNLSRLFTYPNTMYESFVTNVVQVEVSALPIKLQFTKWLIDHEPSAKVRNDHLTTLFNFAFGDLVTFPTDDNLSLFFQAITISLPDAESAFTRIWKLSVVTFPMLKVIVLLHWLVKRISPDQIASCKDILSVMADSFDEPWRVHALSFVLARAPFSGAALLYPP